MAAHLVVRADEEKTLSKPKHLEALKSPDNPFSPSKPGPGASEPRRLIVINTHSQAKAPAYSRPPLSKLGSDPADLAITEERELNNTTNVTYLESDASLLDINKHIQDIETAPHDPFTFLTKN